MKYNLNSFIGQSKIKQQLLLFIFPKLKKQKFCDNILLEGTPGTGKTTLATIIANESKAKLIKVMSPSVKNKSDLISVFCNIDEGSVIFFDEVHRLDSSIEEMLYQIMDEKKISIVIGKEGDSRLVTIELPKFTIIAATTLSGLLANPFKERFGFRLHMKDYLKDEIKQIIKQNLTTPLQDNLIEYITIHSKNIPRIAINITKRINDYSEYLKKNLNETDIREVLDLLGYKFGLNRQDVEYLELLKREGPLSLDTIAKKMSIEKVNINGDIEPYLLKKSFIDLNSRGRNITKRGRELLKEIS